MPTAILGIDIGGSGIKGAPVDVESGELLDERYRLKTPEPSIPEAVGDQVARVVAHFNWKGLIGSTFPAIVKRGITLSAANVDQSWIGYPAENLLNAKTGCPVLLINDADAAGIAEMQFGAGRGKQGTVIMLTFGTGIGSAIFRNGLLVPNAELGHLELRGKDAEKRAAARIRTEKSLTWGAWARRVNEFLARLDLLFSPDFLIIGGGVSKRFDKFGHLLKSNAVIVPAELFNNAGIVGAAWAARDLAPRP